MDTAYTDDYVMGRTSQEYNRLREQAKFWEPATQRILQQTALHSGQSCLDVGSGPGEVMRLMADMVGPTGSVTGIDMDGKIGNEALGILQQGNKSQYAFVQDNLMTVTDIPGQPFDVTYTRIVLAHAPDPIAVLRKMYQWTKPGGYIVVQEYDFHSWNIYPPIDSLSEIQRVFLTVLEKAGRDAYVGYKLPGYFIEAGIGNPDGTDLAGAFGSVDSFKSMLLTVYQSVLPVALRMGITDEATSQKTIEGLSKDAEQSSYLVWPLLLGVWKRKPLA